MAHTFTTAAAVVGFLTTALISSATELALSAETAPPPSQAVLRDGQGDVWGGNDSRELSRWEKVGSRPAFDVTRLRAAHASEAVTARMRFADLRRRGELIYIVAVRTPELTARALVYSGEGFGAGEHILVEDDEEWTDIPCPDMSHRVDFAGDVVDVRIPTQCLGGPAWVRVQGRNLAWVEARGFTGFTDNPHNRQAVVSGFTPQLYPPPPPPVS